LEKLAAELGGLETAIADVSRPETVRALVERGDVLLSTVGPFVRSGDPAVEAAVDAGALYLDSTGESGFIRRVFEHYGPQAEKAGTTLLTAFGCDWVPGNLAGELALREAGDSGVKLEIGYFTDSGISGGTKSSSVGAILDKSYAFRGGRLRTEPAGSRVRSFDLPSGRSATGVSVGGTEHFALPAEHPALKEIGVHLGVDGSDSKVMPLAMHALPLLARAGGLITGIPAVNKGLRSVADKRIKGSTGGPSEESRARTSSTIVARALGANGNERANVTLKGVNPYTFTFEILAWGAQQLAESPPEQTGALGPTQAFPIDVLEEGVAESGLTRA
jgi:short subunit dehydrogenase-like uncharacterized protein